MNTVIHFCSVMLIVIHSVNAVNIEGQLIFKDDFPASNIPISLNDDEYSTLSKADGCFSFYGVPSGIYLLEILETSHIYSNYKIRVIAENETLHVLEYKFPGAQKTAASHPLKIAPHAQQNYFKVREPLSIQGIIYGNPMMIMMVVTFGMMIFFPKMLEGVDPEAMKEMQKPRETGEAMKNFQQMLGVQSNDNDDD